MAIDLALAGSVQLAGTAAPSAVTAGGASAADADRFAAMMNTTSTAGAPSGYAAPVQASEPVRAASGAHGVSDKKLGMGDAILRSLDSAGHAYAESNRGILEVLGSGGGHIGAADMLRIQFEVVQSSIAAELVGKGVSMATKHVDNLTKLQ